MELVHEGEPVQVLEPGECFGQASMLTGMAPTFTVRAREASRCALLSAQAGRRVLGTEAGATYVAESMRKRLTYTGHTVHGLLDVGTAPVSAVMSRPVFCGPEEPLREAASRLGREGVSALLIRLEDDRLGILTDASVRAAVAVNGVSLDAPVRRAARCPVPTVPVDQLAIEATVEMLAAGAEHLAVLEGDRVCGLVSATDLLSLETRSPIALRHMLLGAPDEEALVRAAGRIPGLFLVLSRAGVPPPDLGRVLSLQLDTLVAGLIEFSIARHGPAPASWGWLDLGSAARRELTLASDQDNALAYASVSDGGSAQDVDDYFARLGADVNDGLVRCGIGVDNNGVLARNRQWRMSSEDWLKTFDGVPAGTRRVAPDPRHRGVRLPLERRRVDHRTGADRADASRPDPRPVHAPDGTDGDGLPGRAGLPRPAGGGAARGSARPIGSEARWRSSRSSTWCAFTHSRTESRSPRRSTESRPWPGWAVWSATSRTGCAKRSWPSTASVSSTTRPRCRLTCRPTT